jgi:hypothetical protein
MHPLKRFAVLAGLAFVAAVIEQWLWPHHGRAVGTGLGVVTLLLVGVADGWLRSDRHRAAGDILVGRVLLGGVAALVVVLLLLEVTDLAGYLVLAVVIGLGVLLLGGTAILDWWAIRRSR